jgi:hypothetical protein
VPFFPGDIRVNDAACDCGSIGPTISCKGAVVVVGLLAKWKFGHFTCILPPSREFYPARNCRYRTIGGDRTIPVEENEGVFLVFRMPFSEPLLKSYQIFCVIFCFGLVMPNVFLVGQFGRSFQHYEERVRIEDDVFVCYRKSQLVQLLLVLSIQSFTASWSLPPSVANSSFILLNGGSSSPLFSHDSLPAGSLIYS